METSPSDKGKGKISLTIAGHSSINAQDVIPAEFYLASGEDESLSISLDRSAASVEEAKTLALHATATEGAEVTWSSSDTSIATVDASTGVVTGVDAGTTQIIASFTEENVTYSAFCTVTVTGGEG